MRTVQVKNVVIGQGAPKICVPIVGRTKEDIIAEAFRMQALPADVVEWRVDWFEGADSIEKILDTLHGLVPALQGKPLLFTFRTAREGGERAINPEDYVALNNTVSESRLADLIDVEAFTGDEAVTSIIECAHQHGVKVVASYHDFAGTPPKEGIIARLRHMQKLGADIPKIAVMPGSLKDVLTLLEATAAMVERYADRPIVTMSMAEKGLISRLVGEQFGSALTFGSAGKASAPGQIGAQELAQVLQVIHGSLSTDIK